MSVQKSWPERSEVNGRPLVAHGRADGDELRHVGPPLVAPDVQAHADDAVGPERVGLLLHAGHGEVARLVHGLGQRLHLAVAAPRGLKTDVVDRGADHQPDRVKAGLLDQQELVDRQVGGEQSRLVLLQANAPGLGDAGQ